MKELIVITGPTACGKTKFSVELAKKIGGEIISADSMQVYKYMDIGTAKASKEEMDGINHYLIDEVYPDEEFSVAMFQKKAKEYIEVIKSKGKVPIVAGGTGFYVNALLYDNDFTQTVKNDDYRNKLYNIAKEKGNIFLWENLREVDPESSEKIHHNNVKKVVRALEYYQQTGIKISSHNKEQKQKPMKYDASVFILTGERQTIYDRIEKRVDEMIDTGLIAEVSKLLEMGYSEDLVSMQGIGYKEIVKYLKNEVMIEEAITELKRNTRRYAKRQITWFNGQIEGKWLDVMSSDKIDGLIDEMLNSL